MALYLLGNSKKIKSESSNMQISETLKDRSFIINNASHISLFDLFMKFWIKLNISFHRVL